MSVFSLDPGTKPEVTQVLERLMRQRIRCRIWYGDVDTGKAWAEENNVLGTIGRSTGRRKVALLLHNANSMGGDAIRTAWIVRIDTTWDRCTIYQHPTFSSGFETGRVVPPSTAGSAADLLYGVQDNDGELIACFSSEKRAANWLAFMRGERYAK